MRITVTIELDRDGASGVLTALAGILDEGDTVSVVEDTAEPAEPTVTADPAPKKRAPRRKAETVAEPPVLTLVETPAAEPAAFEAIMAAQAEAAAEFDYEGARAAIRGLMIDTLGLTWARQHVLPAYGSLSAVPDADLPGLLERAEADTAKMLAAEAEADVAAGVA